MPSARTAVASLLMLMPFAHSNAQVRADPGVVIDGKVAVAVTVTLSDGTDPYHPVRNLSLRITRPESVADSLTLVTDESGTVTALLKPGAYRLASVRPTDWQSRWYSWDVALVVRAGMKTVALTGVNATQPGGTAMTVITGRPPSSPTLARPLAAASTPPVDEPAPNRQGVRQRSSFRLFTGSVGFVHTPDDDGMSLSLGLGGVVARRLVGFLFPLDVGIVPNKSTRYYTDTFDNGNSACRDSETGQFADKSNCAADIIYAASAEAGFALTTGRHPVYLTGGYRVGAGETGFAALTVAFQPLTGMHWFGKASIGREFTQVVLGGSVPW